MPEIESVAVTFTTNVDLPHVQADMTDQDWIDLGRFVADVAAATRSNFLTGVDATNALASGATITILHPAGGGGRASEAADTVPA